MSKRHSTFFSSTQNNKSALTLRENRPSHKLRDGEVVVFLRIDSEQWQCRYRLKDIGWVRRTTGSRNLEVAIECACDWYDEARYRLRAGLADARTLLQQTQRNNGSSSVGLTELSKTSFA